MTEQYEQRFPEQGGAATMDPGVVRRWLTSKMMTLMSSEPAQNRARMKAERSTCSQFGDANERGCKEARQIRCWKK